MRYRLYVTAIDSTTALMNEIITSLSRLRRHSGLVSFGFGIFRSVTFGFLHLFLTFCCQNYTDFDIPRSHIPQCSLDECSLLEWPLLLPPAGRFPWQLAVSTAQRERCVKKSVMVQHRDGAQMLIVRTSYLPSSQSRCPADLVLPLIPA